MNALVLVSGGLDSAACLQYYLTHELDVEALHVSYGQMAEKKEVLAARAVCKFYGVPLAHASLKNVVVGNGEITGRNALLLSVALLRLGSTATSLVGIGIHAGTPYADCSPAFVTATQSLFDLYSGGRIFIDAPFVAWSKKDIYEFIASSAVVAMTYSCEVGGQRPCGECPSCHDVRSLTC
jgi:7-cyano-7-deazaguanine synthase